MDTMVSRRPYQDVIAINDLSDLEELEMRRRRRLAAGKDGKNRVRWFDESDTENHKGLFSKYDDFKAPGEENPNKGIGVLDPNVYATKKTIAQGLLDVALLTANASQLKYLLQVGKEHEFYYVMMTLISLSIILQMCLGSVLIIKGRCDINDASQQAKAEKLNDAAVLLVFASTVVHTFLSVFHIHPEEQLPFSYYAQNETTTTTEPTDLDDDDIS